MPWKERHVMDERLRFVARLLEGEKMAPLCAEFGISRKTGYKIFERAVQGLRPRGAQRSEPAAVSSSESTAAAPAGHQHRSCGARPPRPGAPASATPTRSHGHRVVAADRAERAVVC